MPDATARVALDATTPPLRLRWIVNVATWRPADAEFEFILTLLPSHERDAVRRFRRFDDRKRAVVSRLMQRACIMRACETSSEGRWRRARFDSLDVRRTKGSKPFHGARLGLTHAPNFNYNVSHEGDYVVLASETHAVVGVDVAAPGQVRAVANGSGRDARGVGTLLETFSSVLTDRERAVIEEKTRRDGERAGEELFRKHWSLKEAHVKAIGVGLGMDLRRCEFRISDVDAETSTARVVVDDVVRDDWAFSTQAFPPGGKDGPSADAHWISVSRGPIADVVDANGEFLDVVFAERSFSEDAWRDILSAPSPSFELLTVGDLIPKEHHDEFEMNGGDLF